MSESATSDGARPVGGGGPDVIGLGLACLDVLVRVERMPTWERGGAIEDMAFDGGGPAGTAMVAAARLGARAGYIGTAGNDELAEIKLRSLREAGVDLSRVAFRDQHEHQIIVVYVNAETGDRTFSGMKKLSTDPIRPDELDRDYVTSARYLLLDSFHREAGLTAARWMREAGRTVVYDTGFVSEYTHALLPFVDVLIASEGYTKKLIGEGPIESMGPKVLARGPRLYVETHGARGSYTFTADDQFHTPAFEVEVVDTTGAGDVFHGAYIAGMARGWDARFTATFASAVSAIKCTRLGGRRGIPTFQQARDFLAERGVAVPATSPPEKEPCP